MNPITFLGGFQVLLIYMDTHPPHHTKISVWGYAIVQIIRQRSDFIDGDEDNVRQSTTEIN